MAFKGDSDDPRECLSYKLRKVLEYEAAEVLCTDVYIKDPAFHPLDEVIERSDMLIVGAPHREYRALKLPEGEAGHRHLEHLRERCVARVKTLVTGSAGFIAGYLVEDLLAAGHEVVGLDNFSKYGPLERAFDTNPKLPRRQGRRQGRRPAQGAARRLRPLRRRRRDHRRDLALPRAGLRPDRRERADHRLGLRRGDLGPQGREAEEDHRRLVVDGLREHDRLPDARGGGAEEPAAAVDLRLPEAGDGVFRQGRLGAVQAARTRSSGRSTAWASARSGRCRTGTSSRATSSWR